MIMKIKDLKRVALLLFDNLEAQGITEIELKEDSYWIVDSDEAYNMNQEPTDLLVGQLNYDFKQFERISKNIDEPVNLSFIWYAALLKYIGDRVGEQW